MRPPVQTTSTSTSSTASTTGAAVFINGSIEGKARSSHIDVLAIAPQTVTIPCESSEFRTATGAHSSIAIDNVLTQHNSEPVDRNASGIVNNVNERSKFSGNIVSNANAYTYDNNATHQRPPHHCHLERETHSQSVQQKPCASAQCEFRANSEQFNLLSCPSECQTQADCDSEISPLLERNVHNSIVLAKTNSASLIFTKKEFSPVVHRKKAIDISGFDADNVSQSQHQQRRSLQFHTGFSLSNSGSSDSQTTSVAKHTKSGGGGQERRKHVKSWYASIYSTLDEFAELDLKVSHWWWFDCLHFNWCWHFYAIHRSIYLSLFRWQRSLRTKSRLQLIQWGWRDHNKISSRMHSDWKIHSNKK